MAPEGTVHLGHLLMGPTGGPYSYWTHQELERIRVHEELVRVRRKKRHKCLLRRIRKRKKGY